MNTLNSLFWEIVFVSVPITLFVGGYIAAPLLLAVSWSRWFSSDRHWTPYSTLSFGGLLLATASSVLAIAAIAYSSTIGGDFPHHFDDPLFMKLFQWGLLLSRIGIAAGLCGLWRPNTLRWQGIASAVGVWMFWRFTGGN